MMINAMLTYLEFNNSITKQALKQNTPIKQTLNSNHTNLTASKVKSSILNEQFT